jgi:hypothetical protein
MAAPGGLEGLLCSPERDYVINGKKEKVPVSSLGAKQVGTCSLSRGVCLSHTHSLSLSLSLCAIDPTAVVKGWLNLYARTRV